MKHFKQKEKRKHSIKRQMIAVFAGMVICLLAILLIVNVKFLEPYYIRDKEMQFIHVYEELQEAVKRAQSVMMKYKMNYMYSVRRITFLILCWIWIMKN